MTDQSTLPTLEILRRQQVQKRTGLPRSSLQQLIRQGQFPRPISLSARTVGWLSHEVEAWLRDRVSQRDTHHSLNEDTDDQIHSQ